MLIEKQKHLAKASKNNKNLTATTAAKQHDHVAVFFGKLLLTFRHNFHQSHAHRYSSYKTTTTTRAIMGVLGVISLSLLPLLCVDAVGYSYTRFIGPVAGPEHRIYVNDDGSVQSGGAAHNHASRLDYVAKPEYEFAYGVEDAEAHILHNRNEMRDGDDVKGVYSVVDPDGTLRVVKYTADEANGFQAEVITNGVSSLHGGQQQQQQQHYGTPSNNNNNHNNYLTQSGGGINRPSHAAYTPSLEQHINHYYPQNLYPTPPPTPIIYQYNNNDNYNNNNNNNNDDVDNGNGNDYDYQPQYEVHEKQNDKDHKENNKDDNGNQYDDDNDYDSNNDDGGGDDGNKKKTKPENDNKKKKGHKDGGNDDDDDDDDSDDDYDDSEELQDYDEAVRSNEASEENDDYY